VDLTTLALAGGGLWLAGWAMMAWAWGRRRRAPARRGLATMLAAAVVAVGGIRQAETLSGRRAAVIVDPTRLRALPMLGAESGAETLVGEVGRVLGQNGVWTRVQLTDGRRGWMENRRLQTLGVE
jgi:hypothetical protein